MLREASSRRCAHSRPVFNCPPQVTPFPYYNPCTTLLFEAESEPGRDQGVHAPSGELRSVALCAVDHLGGQSLIEFVRNGLQGVELWPHGGFIPQV